MSELYHHQIKGARWGERNGPPYPLSPEDHTAAQIKSNPKIAKEVREAKEEKKKARQESRRSHLMARIVKRSKKDSQKGNIAKAGERAKKMSDEELSEAIKRLRLENEYLDAIQKNNPERQKRESVVRKAVGDALRQVGTEALKYAFATGINKFVSSVTGEDAYIVNPDTGKLYGSKKPGKKNDDKDDKGDKGDKDKGSNKSEKQDDRPEQEPSPSPDRPSEEKPKPAPKEEKPPKHDKGKKYQIWAQRKADKEWKADRRASEDWEAMQVSKDKQIGKSRGRQKDVEREAREWQKMRKSGYYQIGDSEREEPQPFFPVTPPTREKQAAPSREEQKMPVWADVSRYMPSYAKESKETKDAWRRMRKHPERESPDYENISAKRKKKMKC